MLHWNCQGHRVFKRGCEDCEQITREMQPEYCVMGIGAMSNPHEWVSRRVGGDPQEASSMDQVTVCKKCGIERPANAVPSLTDT